MIKRTLSKELRAEDSQIQKNQSSDVLRQPNDPEQSKKVEQQMQQKSYHSMKTKTVVPKRVSKVQIEEIHLKKAQTVKDPQQPSIGGVRGTKLPIGMVGSIRKRATGKKAHAQNQNKLKVSKFMVSKIKEIRDHFVCPICECEYQQQEKSILCDCPHQFCDSCLQHYVIYRVGIFQQVYCPNEQCDVVMNTQLNFFKNLPQDIRTKYKKIHAFYLTSKDPLLRLCPSEKCDDGILKLMEGVNPKCSACQIVFCEHCFFKEHEGPCQKNQIDFFENNLHYRQCNQCKNVIQKSQGCNHMTCRCGYQFCYVCGTKWNGYDHICPNNANVANNPNAARNPAPQEPCCGGICCGILMVPLFLLAFILRTIKMIVLLLIFFLLSIGAGMCPAACQLLSEADNCFIKLLMIIFFPIVMLVGIAITMRQIFCNAAGEQLEEYCDDLGAYSRWVCDC